MPSGRIDRIALALFVPADRPELLEKAISCGADAVIVDLEDAVPEDRKGIARRCLASADVVLAQASCPIFIRINGLGSPFHDEDLGLAARLPVTGIVVPKAESPQALGMISRAVGDKLAIIALVETAVGLREVHAIAQAADRLAFGAIDYALDVGCAATREALLFARAQIVAASRAAGRPGPVDGITVALKDPAMVEADAAYASSLGFAGKLLIHPAQLDPARRGFAPTPADVAWARRVLEATQDGAAQAVDGTMVDTPVRARAERILRDAALIRDPTDVHRRVS